MALTLEQDYRDALGQGFSESWLVEISNEGGSGTAAYIRLGTEEVGSDASKYHALILNNMSLRESIDLEKGTAKTGNITITCHNGQLSNHSNAKLSQEILNQGTRYYLNNTVTVKSKVGSISSSNYLTIFTGRLKDVKLNSNHQVTLTIASATPIDFIKIPEYQSIAGNYFPIVYGNYKNAPASNSGSQDFIDDDTDVAVFPVQVDTIKGDVGYNCLVHSSSTVFGTATDSGKDIGAIGDGSMIASSEDNTIDIINSGSNTVFNAGDIIQVDSEKMLVLSSALVPSTFESLFVVRGFANTTLAEHADGASIFNVPITSGSGKLHYSVPDAVRNQDNYPLFSPLNSSGVFVNTYETQNASGDLIEDDNRKITQTPLDLERSYKYRPRIDDLIIQPKALVSPSGHSSNITANITEDSTNNRTKANDTSNTTFAEFDHSISFSSSMTNSDTDTRDKVIFKFKNTKDDHKVTEYKLTVLYDVASYTNGLSGSDSQDGYEIQIQATGKYGNGKSSNANDISFDSNTTDRSKTFNFLSTSDFTNADGNPPSEIELAIEFECFNARANNSASSTVKIKDIFLTISSKIVPESDSDVNPLEHESAVKAVKKLYCGGDGATKHFSSGVVDNIADMHRDILSRYAGRGGSSETPEGYSDLASARSAWKIQYWNTKPLEIAKLLDKLQFEGGFIFRFRTSDEKPQYIHIPNGNPTVDHKIGLEDISNFDLSVSPIDRLVTKRIIKYQKSPITNQQIYEQTAEDTSNSIRSNYNILSNENIATNALDILIDDGDLDKSTSAINTGSGNRNDSFANYYRTINGIPKFTANVEIINSQSSNSGDSSKYFYGMEVGDFCQFESTVINNMPVFNGLTTSTIFIVISITRSPGSLKVVLREI